MIILNPCINKSKSKVAERAKISAPQTNAVKLAIIPLNFFEYVIPDLIILFVYVFCFFLEAILDYGDFVYIF